MEMSTEALQVLSKEPLSGREYHSPTVAGRYTYMLRVAESAAPSERES
jgi:hypothetical protein